MENITSETNTFTIKQEEKLRILKERAIQLSKPADNETLAGTVMTGLCFLLSEEQYITDSNYVIEVLPLNELTPLPCTPSFLLGIINVRGRILSVLNLKNFFNLPEKGITNLNRVIVVKSLGIELGLLVDEVVGNTDIILEQLQQSLPTINQRLKEYLIGINHNFSIVIDIAKFLADDKIIINEEV
jgi:purine-binding chemotaxis protein CheW